MALRETLQQYVTRAQVSAVGSLNLFSLRSESLAVLHALGVPQTYHLSLKQQGILVDAFAAVLAESKQQGWFAIDTLLADMRGDRQDVRERHKRMTQLKEAQGFFTRRAEKRKVSLSQENKQTFDAALGTVQYMYNVTLRGETNRLASVPHLRTCRRAIRQQGARVRERLVRAA